MLKKYKDDERPKNKCYDCKIPYHSFADMVVPDDIWELINPTYHKECGLLCPTCMAVRLSYVPGIGEVKCTLYLGHKVNN